MLSSRWQAWKVAIPGLGPGGAVVLAVVGLSLGVTACSGRSEAASDRALDRAVEALRTGGLEEAEEHITGSVQAIRKSPEALVKWPDKVMERAELLSREGHHLQAIELSDWGIALMDRMWGNYDPVTKPLRERRIWLYLEANESDLAEQALADAIRQPQEEEDRESQGRVAERIVKVAEAFDERREWRRAENLHRRALEIVEGVLVEAGESGVDLERIRTLWIYARAQLGVDAALRHQGRVEEGEAFVQKARDTVDAIRAAEKELDPADALVSDWAAHEEYVTSRLEPAP